MPVAPPEDLQTPSLAQFIASAMNWRLEDVHTCSWGTVSSYDAASQRAVVQLAPRLVSTGEDGERVTDRPAPLVGVPVIFPGSGGYTITWPLSGGDPVLVVFGERAMHQWTSGGQDDVDPDDPRMHALSDAIAIPGLRNGPVPGGTPPDDALVITVPSGKTIKLGDKDVKKRAATADDIAILRFIIQSITSAPDLVWDAAVLAAEAALGIAGLDDPTTYTPSGLSVSPRFPAGAAAVKVK